jgi:hypothetical protein
MFLFFWVQIFTKKLTKNKMWEGIEKKRAQNKDGIAKPLGPSILDCKHSFIVK